MPLDSLTPFSDEDGITLYNADCLGVLPLLPENSMDSLVTDPPAGIAFMAKHWDRFNHASSPRTAFVDAMTLIFRECLRVLKPGAHGLVWSIPRTSHWTAWALEDAGFIVRDRVSHLFGSGFPKSLDVGRAVDAAQATEGEWIRQDHPGRPGIRIRPLDGTFGDHQHVHSRPNNPEGLRHVYAPTTEAAKQWDGWGTALKPACEDWWLVRKPLIGTVAQNILEHGTGGLDIGGCRIGTGGEDLGDPSRFLSSDQNLHDGWQRPHKSNDELMASRAEDRFERTANLGRWPANVILSHSESCQLIGTKKASSNGHYPSSRGQGGLGTGGHAGQDDLEERFTKDEEIEDWRCVESCPVRMLNEQSGELTSGSLTGQPRTENNIYGGASGTLGRPRFHTGDSGGAARFFYCAKSSVEDREDGLEDLEAKQRDESRQEGNPGGDNPRNRGLSLRKNSHPTVKSTDLMRFLVRLITPPGGTVLDCFAGSGSTGKACALEGFKAILIERELEYAEIAKRRSRLKQKRLF